MNELEMKHLLEAAILAAGRPLTTEQLSELFDERERPSVEQVLIALTELQSDYEGRGLQVVEVSSGWRIQVRDNCVEFVSRLWQERPARYSRALLETLALIAYRQPITRGEIEEIRGVAVSSTIMRTLHDRNWIRVVGHREVPGRPEVLATTKEFLDYFGLKSLDELPTLAELKDVETIGVQLEFDTAADIKSDGEQAADGNAEASAEVTTETTDKAVAELTATDTGAETVDTQAADVAEEHASEVVSEAKEDESDADASSDAEVADSVDTESAATEADGETAETEKQVANAATEETVS